MENKKFEIVKKYIDKLDYMDFLNSGCPEDEYDGESKEIADNINASMSAEEIALIIAEVFNFYFNTGYILNDMGEFVLYKDPLDPEVGKIPAGGLILDTAKDIYNELQQL